MTRADAIAWACANAIDGVSITPLVKRAGRSIKHGIRIDAGDHEVDLLLLIEDGKACKRLLLEKVGRYLRRPSYSMRVRPDTALGCFAWRVFLDGEEVACGGSRSEKGAERKAIQWIRENA